MAGTYSEHRLSIMDLPRWVSRGPKFASQRVFSLIIHTSKLGAIVVNIDCDAYEEMIQLESSDYINILEVCGDGDVLISSDPELWGTNVNDDDTYKKSPSVFQKRIISWKALDY